MGVALDTGCVLLGLGTLAFWLRRLVAGPRTLSLVALAVYVGASTLSFFVLLPAVYAWIGGRSHVVNLAGAISGVCVLVLLGAQQVLLMHWTYTPDLARVATRLRLSLIGLATVAYIGTFAAQIPKRQRFSHFYLLYSRHPGQAPYLIIYIVACTVGEIDVLRYCVRYARIARRRWLRRGMIVTVTGAVCILVYCAIRISDLVQNLIGFDPHLAEPVAWFFGDVGSALSLIGWVLPAAGPYLSAGANRLRVRRQLDLLYPLWVRLLQSAPSVALAPPTARWRDRLRVRNLDFWLYRRVIEIEDCLRAMDVPARRSGLGNGDQRGYEADLNRLMSLARSLSKEQPSLVWDHAGHIVWRSRREGRFSLSSDATIDNHRHS